VVTADGLTALVSRQAEMLFGASPRDVGRPFRDLEVSYRPLELRRLIDQAAAERRTVRANNVTCSRGGEVLHYDVHVTPLVAANNGLLGVSVAFLDVTDFHRLRDELEQANRQLETAYEELQSTNEELETTNEELQSTVEELETTNEELQSTNEELETMNAELQATNDELQTTNDELQARTGDLNRANVFLETILTGLRAGIVVLDPNLHVQVWNQQAQELWGLRTEEDRRPALPQPRHRPADRSSPTDDPVRPERGGHDRGADAVGRQPARARHRRPRAGHAAA
jgi:two-component system CheB/CheR fusion protein